MSLPTNAPTSLYPYTPSKAAPLLFLILILLLGLIHAERSFHRYRWARFGGSMLFAALSWAGGFLCRALSAWSPTNINLYIAQYVLILAGPSLFAAAETFILGRLFAYLPHLAPMHPGRVISTFILLSAAAEALAVAGASQQASAALRTDDVAAANDARIAGTKLVEAGMVLQLVIELLFCALVGTLQMRCRRSFGVSKTNTNTQPSSSDDSDQTTSLPAKPTTTGTPRNVRTMCLVLYITSLMMMARCGVRIAEAFEAGSCGPDASSAYSCGGMYVQRHEWVLWVFEVANITVFVGALALFFPGRYLPASDRQYLDVRACAQGDVGVERLGPGWSQADERPWLVTVLDPFDWAGAVRRRGGGGDEGGVQRFWERDNPVAPTCFETGYGRREERRAELGREGKAGVV